MKNNLRKLNLLFRFTKLKPEMFYSINIMQDKIVLQGFYKAETAVAIKKVFKQNGYVSESGFIEFLKNKIEIVLT